MAISTQRSWMRLTDELQRLFRPSEPHTDSDGRLRHTWRKVPSGADWMVLCSLRHFDFRKNILQSIEQNDNAAYAILCGIKNDEWRVYMTDFVPLGLIYL